MIDICTFHLFLILLIPMESCLPNAFAHVEPCELVIIPGWAGMVTAHIFIKGGGEGNCLECTFFHGLNSAQEPSNFGGDPAYFCFNVPRRFQIST